MNIDDIEDIEDDSTYILKKTIETDSIYSITKPGTIVRYSITNKDFTINKNGNGPLIGYFLNYNEYNSHINCIYKGYLNMNSTFEIPLTVKPEYYQVYIKKLFLNSMNNIISNMPRVKRLKRLNFKIMSRSLAIVFSKNIDNVLIL